MKKTVMISIVLILIMILTSYLLISIKWIEKPTQNNIDNTVSIKDLYTDPTEYLNKTVNVTGKIWKRDIDNFVNQPEYFQEKIKREYIFTPFKNDTWKIYSNNTYLVNDLFIEIYAENLSFDNFLRTQITLTGYFREFPSEYHYSDSLLDKYYIEVINITILNSDNT